MKQKKFGIVLLSCVMVISLLFTSTAYAQDEELQLPNPGITPDSPFYFADIWGKKIGLFFTFGAEAKANKALEYAEERLAEVRIMAAKNKSRGVKQAVGGYDEFLAIVTEKAEEARRQGVSGNISEIVALATSKHLSIFDEVEDIVPEEAKEAIAQARGASINGLGNGLRALATENPERAMEINLAAVEGRLNRVKAKAKGNEIGGLEVALQEFQGLNEVGEEISQIAKRVDEDPATVYELVALATLKHLSIFDEVEDIVPEEAKEAKEAIAQARGASINGLGNGLRALAGENPERAMEINLAAMEGRLNRANTEADENNPEGVGDAVHEFEVLSGFGREISEMARGLSDNTTVDQLVARAASHHLEVLALVYDKVPEQAKSAIERVMGVSVTGRQKAVEALMGKGALGEIPEEVTLPAAIPDVAKKRILKLKVPNPGVSESEIEEEGEEQTQGMERGRRP